jgi:hypothetical protein
MRKQRGEEKCRVEVEEQLGKEIRGVSEYLLEYMVYHQGGRGAGLQG